MHINRKQMFKIAVPELVDPEAHVSGDDSPNFKPIVEHRSDEEWTFKRTYFYTHGETAQSWSEEVVEFFKPFGFEFVPTESQQVYHSWPKESYFYTRGYFTEIPVEETPEESEEPSPEVVNDVNSSIQIIDTLGHLMTPDETEDSEMVMNWLSDDQDYDLVQPHLGELATTLINRETDQVPDLTEILVQEEVELRYADDSFYMTKEGAGHYSFVDTFDRTWTLILTSPDIWNLNMRGSSSVFTTKRSAMKHMLQCIIQVEWSDDPFAESQK